MLTVVASMEQELAGLRQELRREPIAARGPGDWTSTLSLQVVGVGRKAETNVRSLLARRLDSPGGQMEPRRCLLSLGFAGAVDPALESGDLVLSSRYYRATEDKNPPNLTLLNESERRFNSLPPSNKVPTEEEDQQDYFTADPTMWRHAVKAAEGLARPAVPVESLTVNDLMTTPQAKEALRRSYEVGVIDMEDYWVASAAHDAGVPFLSARVVLDRVDQSLPSYLLRFTESRATAILQTVAKPWRIPVLINLARRLPAAQHTLARFALFFSAQLASNQPAHSHQGAAGPGALNGASRSIGE